MSEIITIQVGQCGNQIGGAFWPLALHEHGIKSTSIGMNFLKTQGDRVAHMADLSDAFGSFFHVPEKARQSSFQQIADLADAKVKARAVLIDMEDSVVSRFKQGPLRQLFDQACTVTNYPGSGNNWAVGYHTHGRAYNDKIEEAIRRTAERCDRLQGFLLLHSLGGGTGSGLGTSTLKFLDDNYPEIDRLVSCVYPAANRDVVTAPYNVLLATEKLIEHATCVFPADNSALIDICKAELQNRNNKDQLRYNATCQSFQDMNSLIVNMLLHLTSGARFPGSLNTDINEIVTNLVPYPKLHHIFSSVAPISLTAPALSTAQGPKLQDELFGSAWSRKNQLIKFDPLSPKSVVTGCAHISRGSASLTDIRRNVERFQGMAKFTAWSKEAMKVGLCSVPPAGHSASLLCLINSSSMSSMMNDVLSQFDKLYQKKAYVHHYSEVDEFEESDFLEARSNVNSVIHRYSELQTRKSANVARLRTI